MRDNEKPSTLVLKADSRYDDVEILRRALSKGGINVSAKGFNIESLGRKFYLLDLPEPLSTKYREIFREFGVVENITEVFGQAKREVDLAIQEEKFGSQSVISRMLRSCEQPGGVWEEEPVLDIYLLDDEGIERV